MSILNSLQQRGVLLESRWRARNLCWVSCAANSIHFGPTGAMCNLVDGGTAVALDGNNYFKQAINQYGVVADGTTGNDPSSTIYSTIKTDLLGGATEITLLTSFIFVSNAPNLQCMNFRLGGYHTLDVFSKTSTSITWGSDWAGAWNGVSQKTLSNLKTGDLVTLVAVINQSGARLFHNGMFAGIKSGSSFTVPTNSFPTRIVQAQAQKYVMSAAFSSAISDAEALIISANPWKLFKKPISIATRSLYAIAANDLLANQTEIVTASDNGVAMLAAIASSIESGAAQDNMQGYSALVGACIDTLIFSDGGIALITAAANGIEYCASHDAAQCEHGSDGVMVETTGATDYVFGTRTLAITLNEVAAPSGLSEAQLLAAAINVENASAAPAAQCVLDATSQNIETAVLSANASVVGVVLASASETGGASDTAQLFFDRTALLVEQTVAVDTASMLQLAGATLVEMTTASATQQSLLFFGISVTELTQALDFPNASAALYAARIELHSMRDLVRDNQPYFRSDALPAALVRPGVERLMRRPMTDRLLRSGT